MWGSTLSFIQNESVIIFHKLQPVAILNNVIVLSGHNEEYSWKITNISLENDRKTFEFLKN